MFESQQNISKNKQSKKENFSKKGEEEGSIDIAENESENKVLSYQLRANKQNETSPEAIIQKKSNQSKSGLPDGLKKGVENLSGKSMDNVNVHYNSDSPSKIGAHAYTQGTDIHLAKGQEKHLPHEAWHVVQQKQGRVKPTVQMKGKAFLEKEDLLENGDDKIEEKTTTNISLFDDVASSQKTVQKKSDGEEKEAKEEEEDDKEGNTEIKDQAQTDNEALNDDESPSSPDDNPEKKSSVSVKIEPETLLLSGSKGLYSKIKSVFGKETSFGKLLNLVKEFEGENDDEKKKVIGKKIISEGENWLSKHPKEGQKENSQLNKTDTTQKDQKSKGTGFFGALKSGFKSFKSGIKKIKSSFNRISGKTANNDKKRESIKLIVKRFKEASDSSKIKLTSLSDKQSITSKIKGVFGIKTTFKQIEDRYYEYQSKASSSITGYGQLKSILIEASEIVRLIRGWETNHKDDDDSKAKVKLASIKKIEQGIANLFIEANYKNIVNLKVSKLNLSELEQGNVTAKQVDLKINFEGKEISGSGTDVTIGEKGINFKELKIDYNDAVKISDELQISEPKLSISHENDNYEIKAEGEVDLTMEIPNAELTTKGNVQVNYSTATSKFHSLKLAGVSIKAEMFNKNLIVSANGIDYKEGVFSASDGILELSLFGFSSEIKDLTFSKTNGVDWSTIKVKVEKEINTGDIISVKNPEAILRGKSDKYGYDLSGEVGVSVGLPDGATLETTGSATISGVPDETNYELRVEDVGIDLKFGDKLHASASNVNYDKSNKTLSASQTSIEIKLFDKQLSSNVDDLTISKDGVDWELATFETEKLGLDGFIGVKDVVATAKGKKGGYEKHAEGTFEIGENSIPGTSITAEGIRVSMTLKDGKWSFNVIGENLSVGLLDNKLKLTSTKLKYENKKLEMETLGVSLLLPTGNTLTASGKNVVVEKDKIDWNEIRFPLPKILPDIGSLKLDNGDGVLKGKKDNYALGLDVGAAIKKGEWFEASGEASLVWNHKEKNLPEVEDYNMNFNVQSPTLPDAFIPDGAKGAWPIQFSLSMFFMAGPVPMEAEVEFGAKAGASIGIQGTVTKVGDITSISGNGTGTAGLGVWIKGSLGVGSAYLLKLAGFLKGDAMANANINIGLEGKLDSEYNFTSLLGDYVVDAEFIAQLSAGVEAKALVVFSKTLYEVSLKKWELGSSKKEGTYDFINEKDKDKSTKGFFKGDKISEGDLKEPPTVEQNTKEYLDAIKKFNDILREENPKLKVNDIPIEESVFDQKQIKSKKDRIIQILKDSIDDNLSNKEFLKYSNKVNKDEKKLEKQKENHKIQMERQYQKRADVAAGKRTLKQRFKGRDEDHYNKKIERLEKQYREKIQKSIDKLKLHLDKVSIYQNQINTATSYIQNIDPILENPETGLAKIDEQINKYKKMNSEALEQKYSIEKYLLDEDFANQEIDYENDEF